MNDTASDLARLRAAHPRWQIRHDSDSGMWWAERPGALLCADSAESLRLLLAELPAPPRDEA